MIDAVKKTVVFTLVVALVAVGLPHPAHSGLARGAGTASEAASMPEASSSPESPQVSADDAAPVLAFGAMAAFDEPDTTEFQFPEEKKSSLAKDITVWVIASAFVAYFIIKVFLEKDKEEPVDNSPPGKKI